jgi:hypothetical protein
MTSPNPKKRKRGGTKAISRQPPSLHPWAVRVTLAVLVVSAVCCTQRDEDTISTAGVSGPADRTSATDSSSPVLSTASDRAAIPTLGGASWREMDDPSRDGWEMEVFAHRVEQQLKHLGKLVTSGDITSDSVAALIVPAVSTGPLRPDSLAVVYQDEVLLVRRADPDRQTPTQAYQGAEGVAEALRDLAAPFRPAAGDAFKPRSKFKLFRTTLDSSETGTRSLTTRQYFAMSGRTPHGFLEENATWVMRWQPARSDGPPRLQSIAVENFEQVERRTTEPLFRDRTVSLVGHNPSYRDQLLFGFNYWLERLQDKRSYDVFGAPGLALGDINGDGLEDLYLCQEGGLPNRLFVQNSDGSLDDVSETSRTNWLDSTRSALLLDLDNDGDQDLVTALLGSLAVASNDGVGHFQVVAILPTSDDTFGLSASDYDADGDLDLYVCAYEANDLSGSSVLSAGASERFVYHDANTGAPNSLFRNDTSLDATWQFTDVTQEVGLDVNNRRSSFAAAWEDFDNDGDQDLYIANDFGRNNLFQNRGSSDGGPRFADIAAHARAEDRAAGMSVSWGDFDRDGWMDLYVGNMFSAAGSRITQQDNFKAEDPEAKKWLQRFAKGNTLFRNAGDGTFVDLSFDAHVTMGRWAWSSNFVDINNDGWEDLIVANGFITTDDTGDL